MQRFLVTTHMHVLMLIVGVVFIPVLVAFYRKHKGRTVFDSEQNNKLRLDVATLIPVSVLLWNLLIYYFSNIFQANTNGPSAADIPPNLTIGKLTETVLTFEKAVAAAGESTVALATAIIFCRLFGGLWADLHK